MLDSTVAVATARVDATASQQPCERLSGTPLACGTRGTPATVAESERSNSPRHAPPSERAAPSACQARGAREAPARLALMGTVPSCFSSLYSRPVMWCGVKNSGNSRRTHCMFQVAGLRVRVARFVKCRPQIHEQSGTYSYWLLD